MSWVLRVITLPPPKHSNIMIEIKPWQNEFSLPKNFSSKITHEMGGHILQQVLLVEFLVSEVWDHRLPQAFLSMAENRSAAIWSFGSPGSYLFYPFIYFKVWPVPFHALSPTIIRTTCRHILPWYGPSPFELLASPSQPFHYTSDSGRTSGRSPNLSLHHVSMSASLAMRRPDRVVTTCSIAIVGREESGTATSQVKFSSGDLCVSGHILSQWDIYTSWKNCLSNINASQAPYNTTSITFVSASHATAVNCAAQSAQLLPAGSWEVTHTHTHTLGCENVIKCVREVLNGPWQIRLRATCGRQQKGKLDWNPSNTSSCPHLFAICYVGCSRNASEILVIQRKREIEFEQLRAHFASCFFNVVKTRQMVEFGRIHRLYK